MGAGRFAVERIDDVVLVAQEGTFGRRLMERFLAVLDAEVRAAAEGGTCAIVADIRQFLGGPIVAQIAFEAWAIRSASRIRMTAVLTNSAAMRVVMDASSLFVPSFRYRVAADEQTAARAIGRDDLARRMATFFAEPPWQDL